MNNKALEVARRLRDDFIFYAANNLNIKPKTGDYIPFRLNKAQLYLHERIEEQKKRTGKVRICVLKGRQQGCSTYIGARFYHQTVTNKSLLTFIFAHDSESSNGLFNMVKDYWELSDSGFRPERGKSNAKELLFPNLRSGYKVGTAGTGEGLGRSKTFQQVHWSEVAYCRNADVHASGIMQTVSDVDDTEIILESTANGEGDYWHSICMASQSGAGDFELVFIPWYWQEEYKRKLPDDFELQKSNPNDEHTSEEDYYNMFKDDGVTKEHLYWRRHKIAVDFQGDVIRFMREYPFYPEEAFMASSQESFIKPILVKRARNTPIISTSAPLVLGVDPARLGGDKFMVCHRKGRNVTKMEEITAGRVDETANRLAQMIDQYKPAKAFVDAGGLGVGIYDILVGKGYGNVVEKVDFGGASLEPDKNKNKRAEMYRKAKEWLEDAPVCIQLPDKMGAKLQSELSVGAAKWINNSQLLITPKEEIKKELGYSPDCADAFALTFASTISPNVSFKQNMQQTFQAETSWNPF